MIDAQWIDAKLSVLGEAYYLLFFCVKFTPVKELNANGLF